MLQLSSNYLLFTKLAVHHIICLAMRKNYNFADFFKILPLDMLWACFRFIAVFSYWFATEYIYIIFHKYWILHICRRCVCECVRVWNMCIVYFQNKAQECYLKSRFASSGSFWQMFFATSNKYIRRRTQCGLANESDAEYRGLQNIRTNLEILSDDDQR